MNAKENLETIAGMKPEKVWSQFARIATIPRCSEHEEELRAYIEELAEQRGFEHQADTAGNLVVRKPAHPNMKDAPGVVLQGHLDMVCEKNSATKHDFRVDPIRLVRDGEWLRAAETTLGADNGIAVAMILALLEDPEAEHGPLEALFTVHEEGGLIGATRLRPGFIRGKRLINLDSEEEGTFYIGCAGGLDTDGTLPMQTEPAGAGIPSSVSVSFSVTGLQGGHSGSEIHQGRGNAIALGVRFLWHAARAMDLRIHRLEGGGLRNAIPRELFCGLIVGVRDYPKLEEMAREYLKNYQTEIGDIDPGLRLEIHRDSDHPEAHLTKESTDRLLDTLYSIPHGVTAMSHTIDGLVDTSTNLASVQLTKSEARILTSQRSSYASARDDLADRIRAIIEHSGGQVTHSGGYPSWRPEPDSPLIRLCSEIYARKTGTQPVITAIHAGLECGVLGDKFPGTSMISFGPDIEGAHTPQERVHIESTERIWGFLLEVLKALGE